MSDLYGVVGVKAYKNVLADPAGADQIAVAIAPGEGAVPAGRVIVRNETGLWKSAVAADITATALVAVAKEACTAETGAVAPEIGAFRAGKFIKKNATLKADAAITKAVEAALSVHGIVFDISTLDTDTVENN